MISYASSVATGRATPGRVDTILAPARRRPRPPVVYLSGVNGDGTEPLGLHPILRILVETFLDDGHVVVAPTVTATWGSRPDLVDDALALARANGAGDEPPFLVAGSHGVVCALLYACANPVTGVLGFIPCVDPQVIRANDWIGQQAVIDAAWGVSHPAPLPLDANPVTAGDPGCPVQLWYSNDDPISTGVPTYVAGLAAGEAIDVGALGHSDEAIGAADRQRIAAFVRDAAGGRSLATSA